ncbi:motility protein A [Clostridium botulinum]|uniref:motility protein A n=1 Tax=Clostridium botulinum TaxID=1491 RepID=UPI0013FF075C|nr:motility protein A [Clostridium botulinum]MBY6917308.1 motility protein A [Clostridium botulinum]NFO39280.1 motility protein A [Clostridium botulinum]NFQ37403.1 motility protein A [Clostridium botulinum]
MKKTDIMTAVGLLLGSGLMLYGIVSGGPLSIFIDGPSIAITLGGSVSAVLIVYPMDGVKKAGKLFMESFKEPKSSTMETIAQFTELSRKARRDGLLSLEDTISQLEDEFLKKGLQMVVDGIEPESIKEILELDISEMEVRHKSGAGIFSTWGAFAPGFGMLGTLIGLIQMLQNLSDVSTIATGMGKALITTFYGSLIANILASPIAQNLLAKSQKEVAMKEMMLEGILSIQSGVNPRIVEDKLISYLSPKERIVYAKNNSENNEGVA